MAHTGENADMRLDRDTVTSASRIMLPTYVVAFGWIGASYVLQRPATISDHPALAYADELLDLDAWGAMFLVTAGVILAAMVTGSREKAMYALILGLICCVIWWGVFMAAWLWGDGSSSAPAWPMLGAFACFASYRSISRREIGRQPHVE